MIPAGFLLLLLGAAGVIVAGTAIPAGDDVDLVTSAHVTWHPLLGRWTVDELGVDVRDAKLIDIGALFRNALSVSSEARDLVFTLETPSGGVQKSVVQSTGKGKFVSLDGVGSERTETVVFRHIDTGDYVVRARIIDEDGKTLAEKARALRLVSTGGT